MVSNLKLIPHEIGNNYMSLPCSIHLYLNTKLTVISVCKHGNTIYSISASKSLLSLSSQIS